MPRRIFLFVMPIIFLAWFFVFGQTARAAVLPIETNTVWTKAQSPIIVNDYIWLKSGVNLTIEKGVVIKFSFSGMLIISGKLSAIGTKAEPIVLTSVKDDVNGGDSNQDGAATSPQSGDWSSLTVNSGGEVNLDYTTVQYGGSSYYSGGIINYRGKLTINHSIITKNNAGIGNQEGVIIISNSSIINNMMPLVSGAWVDAAIGNNARTDIIVNAANNWWGTAAGPCVWRLLPPANVKSICGDRPLIDLGVVFSPWLNAPADAPAEPDPVILVPGIMGSWEINGKWELDPILHTYDNLWQALKNAGYVEGETLFAFPYEWRQDNILTAYQLKQKIDEVKNICNCDKVDVVAHSMGGLVARYYAESDYYGDDIDRLVFLGTPHKGSPESYLRWEGARGQDGSREQLLNLIFGIEAHARGYNTLFGYIQGYIKSVEQLLPDYAYLQNLGETGFRIYDKNNHPNNYPYNNFLENINSADNINQFNSSGIKIKNFIGDTGDNTINAIKVSSGEQYLPMWKHGYAQEWVKLAGDGTVPELSSSLFTAIKINEVDHNNLPTKAQKQVIKYLTGNLPVAEISDSKIPNMLLVVRIFSPADFVIIAPDGKKLGKDFLSGQAVNKIPGAFYSGFNTDAEFAVIPDPMDGEYKIELQGTGQGEYKLSTSLIDDRRETSREFRGNIAPEQKRDFNITYSAVSENPISELEPIDMVPPVIIINKPTEGDEYPYSDNLIIDYTATDDFSGIATTTITIDGQVIAITTVKLSDYSLGQHNLVIQAIDKAGNQAVEQVNFTIIDNVPPVVAINQPIAGTKYLRSDDLIIDYTATDDFSGLAITAVTIDGLAVAMTTVDLFDYAMGQHSLIISAFDNAGNQAQAQVSFEIIVDIDSAISDIKEIYQRGWLKKGFCRALLENAFKLLKIEAKYFEREQELTEKLIKKTGQDSKLNAKQKQKLIEQYNKKLAELKKNRAKAIGHSLDTIVVLLNNAKKQNKINQAGYDIILSDINYLKENL